MVGQGHSGVLVAEMREGGCPHGHAQQLGAATRIDVVVEGPLAVEALRSHGIEPG